MSRMMMTGTMIAAILTGGLIATPVLATAAKPVKASGKLVVFGNDGDSKLFTSDGVTRAENALNNTSFDHGLTVTVDIYAKPPEGKTVPADEAEKARFFHNWAVDVAKGDKAKGVYILICRSPGYVQVIADKTTRDRGFSDANEKQLRDKLLGSFRAAKVAKDEGKPEADQFKLRDEGLSEAIGFIISDLKDTTVSASTTSTPHAKPRGEMGIGGWICLGLCVLLGVWLVIGVIRALTGAGGGGGGYGPGGGGGGGFGSSLLGGLFGAMAGMWIYNSMFGHGGMFGGSDAYAGDGGMGGSGDTGTSGDGDFSGDTGRWRQLR
ncbi:MAG: hypothetical protein U0792_13715 [Gemmataceae bacterium]